MAVKESVADSDTNNTHTEKIAQEHPEAVKAVADRMGGEEAQFLRRVLDSVSE